MGIRVTEMVHHARQIIRRRSSSSKQQQLSHQTSSSLDVPKGHFAVYVGKQEEKTKRFVVPITYLKHPLFQALLSEAEEEFGFDHKMQGLTIPCAEDVFINLTSQLSNGSS
ncbi:auxin-induced protein 15A-like [Pistacia vera]|uniref:auxin-induced protein 15A-like n=1 Tax=Pistacia vera TaxID=55513 RepID=UPI0012633243|nr:auxin-induced protein 15A-like [Pistacia vera]KAJ0077511.1 hypothetical protein Patl1_36608 [Pistacia atlantica]